eukprot:gene8093-10100_t
MNQIDPGCDGDDISDTCALALLIAPQSVEGFASNNWEKSLLHVSDERIACPTSSNSLPSASAKSAANRRKNLITGLFTLDDLQTIVEEHKLEFIQDVNVCMYKNGRKMNKNPQGISACVSWNALDEHLKDGSTLQFHQPQRYLPKLQQLMVSLESRFGCLFGANVYITPPFSQGLSPHHDDIEAFVLQTVGSKEWMLYPPQQQLASSCSKDLLHSDIGSPVYCGKVKAGDMLYFPRGQIHEARTAAELSIHVTISTYQNWSFGYYLQRALPFCIEEAMRSNIALRRGLPWQFLLKSGFIVEDNSAEIFRKQVKALLTQDDVIDSIVQHIHQATDDFSMDFMMNRLPLPKKPSNASIFKPNLKVALKDPLAVRIIDTVGDNMQDEVDPKHFVLLVHCMSNDASRHMICETDDEIEDEDNGDHIGDDDSDTMGQVVQEMMMEKNECRIEQRKITETASRDDKETVKRKHSDSVATLLCENIPPKRSSRVTESESSSVAEELGNHISSVTTLANTKDHDKIEKKQEASCSMTSVGEQSEQQIESDDESGDTEDDNTNEDEDAGSSASTVPSVMHIPRGAVAVFRALVSSFPKSMIIEHLVDICWSSLEELKIKPNLQADSSTDRTLLSDEDLRDMTLDPVVIVHGLLAMLNDIGILQIVE